MQGSPCRSMLDVVFSASGLKDVSGVCNSNAPGVSYGKCSPEPNIQTPVRSTVPSSSCSVPVTSSVPLSSCSVYCAVKFLSRLPFRIDPVVSTVPSSSCTVPFSSSVLFL